jgi:hypothetical protein
VRLEAARLGYHLWRNNSGAGKLENGSFVRWGLANDSHALNEHIKSSDLIGWDDLGVFLAAECKPEGWRYNPNDAREVAQLRFIQLVNASGGRAGFITHPSQLATLGRTA